MIAAAVLHVYALLGHKPSGTSCVAIDLMNAFLFLSGKTVRDSLHFHERSKIFIICPTLIL